jgi:hypothetical protein
MDNYNDDQAGLDPSVIEGHKLLEAMFDLGQRCREAYGAQYEEQTETFPGL